MHKCDEHKSSHDTFIFITTPFDIAGKKFLNNTSVTNLYSTKFTRSDKAYYC